jgi:hypothetical protein
MQPPQIDYAPAQPGQKRRRFVRRIAFAIATAVLIIIAIKSAPSAWHRVRILYWQRQAMNYAPPADHVVYDDDPADLAKLRRLDPALSVGSNGSLFAFAKPWDQFYQLVSPPGRQAAATLFVHRMQNSKGEERLVVLELNSTSAPGAGTAPHRYCVSIFQPGGLLNDPQELSSGALVIDYAHTINRWCVGQVDPHDPSHLTIQGIENGHPTMLEGWLRDDWLDLRKSP